MLTATHVRRHYRSVTGSVWCDAHGCIHDATTNPYDDTIGCPPEEHRPVFVLARADEKFG